MKVEEIKRILDGLPDDPAQALFELVDLTDQLNFQRTSDVEDKLYCAAFLTLFDVVYGESPPDLPLTVDTITWIREKTKEKQLEAVISDVKGDFASRYRNVFGLFKLTSIEKQNIRDHLDIIKGLVDKSTISLRKKNAIYDRIAKLANEVDRDGTRMDSFLSLLPDIGYAFGKAAENAEPALNESKEILRIVAEARARNDGPSVFSIGKQVTDAIEDGSDRDNK
ncbi:hypothetical protein L5876_04600 [Hyphobacterium sp. SN044]|uniref:hypothetical protein n=1 Tax=Hyphobacterium sp. SN044 TaxID=2912575 RepID=UPI001F2212D9|nr:hypothetical protein [Hyphobacterium sp. SN044]MCF8879090.1 hypothetical protein [Hyphobacterium sp. SN044]